MKTKVNKNIVDASSMLDTEFLLSTDPEIKKKKITTKSGNSFVVKSPSRKVKLSSKAKSKLWRSKIECLKTLTKKQLNELLETDVKARNILQDVAGCHAWMYVSEFEDGMIYYYKLNRESKQLYRHGMASLGNNSFLMKYSRFPNDKELVDIDLISKKYIQEHFRKNFFEPLHTNFQQPDGDLVIDIDGNVCSPEGAVLEGM